MFLTTSNKFYPGPQGLVWVTGAMMKKYAEMALGKKLRHELRRFYGDRFFIPICYGSQDLSRTPTSVTI